MVFAHEARLSKDPCHNESLQPSTDNVLPLQRYSRYNRRNYTRITICSTYILEPFTKSCIAKVYFNANDLMVISNSILKSIEPKVTRTDFLDSMCNG